MGYGLIPAGANLTWEFGQGANPARCVYFGTDKAAVEAGDARVLARQTAGQQLRSRPLRAIPRITGGSTSTLRLAS